MSADPVALDTTRLMTALATIGSQVDRTEQELLTQRQLSPPTPAPVTPPPATPQHSPTRPPGILEPMNRSMREQSSPEEEGNLQVVERERDEDPKPQREQPRKKRHKQTTMPRPETDDLRVTALEAQLAIAEEDVAYWRRLSEEYKRAKDRLNHSGTTAEVSQAPVAVNMSVNVKTEKVTVEHIDGGQITVKTNKVTEPESRMKQQDNKYNNEDNEIAGEEDEVVNSEQRSEEEEIEEDSQTENQTERL